MTTKTNNSWNKIESTLFSQFYGTEGYYKISPFSNLIVTDGIKYIMDELNCYWLFTDFVALELFRVIQQQSIPFALCTIKVDEKHNVTLLGQEDTDMQPFYTSKKVKDLMEELPIGEFQFYLIDGVALVKSEY